MTHGFDRVRPRADGAQSVASVDVQGKSSLFSGAPVNPSLGSAVITCSHCRQASVVSYLRAVRLAVPSLHLYVFRRDYPSWMRCPSCQERHWVRIQVR